MRYLSSLESYTFERVWECELLRWTYFDTGKRAAVVRVTPGVPGGNFNFPGEINELVLASRFQGDELEFDSNVVHFVHIGVFVEGELDAVPTVDGLLVRSLAWGELYSTREAAESHRLR